MSSRIFKRVDLQYLSAALASGLTQDEISQFELGLPFTTKGAKTKRSSEIVRYIFENDSDPDSTLLKLLDYIYLETNGVRNARELLEYKHLLLRVLGPRNIYLADDGYQPSNGSANVDPAEERTPDSRVTVARVPVPTLSERESVVAKQTVPDAIFIVHGHDGDSANKVRIKVHSWTGIMPLVLSEQASGGRTIIEKFEKAAGTSNFALVMLTPDDEGRAKKDPTADLSARARQNVILELGYFYGALGRDRVAVLYKDVELPSDINGVNYISYGSSEWTDELRAELIEAGFALKG